MCRVANFEAVIPRACVASVKWSHMGAPCLFLALPWEAALLELLWSHFSHAFSLFCFGYALHLTAVVLPSQNQYLNRSMDDNTSCSLLTYIFRPWMQILFSFFTKRIGHFIYSCWPIKCHYQCIKQITMCLHVCLPAWSSVSTFVCMQREVAHTIHWRCICFVTMLQHAALRVEDIGVTL